MLNGFGSTDGRSVRQMEPREKLTRWEMPAAGGEESDVFFNDQSWSRAMEVVRERASLKCIEYEPSKRAKAALPYLKSLFDGGMGEEELALRLESISFQNVFVDEAFFRDIVRCMDIGMDSVKIKLTKARLDDGCIAHLAAAMRDGLCVGSLNLGTNSISDGGIAAILSATNSRHLVHLDVSYNNNLTPEGLETIARFLRSNDARIENLSVQQSHPWKQGDVFAFLESVPSTSRLKILNVGKEPKADGTAGGRTLVGIIKNMVCGDSGFDEMCRSNHNFQNLAHHNGDMKLTSSAVREALETNLRSDLSPNQRCRRKLRYIYFTGDFDVQKFIGMDCVLMPNVLELVTMSEGRCEKRRGWLDSGTYVMARNGHLGSIYRLVRNCHLPELFSFPSARTRTEPNSAGALYPPEEVQKLRAENEELKSKLKKLEAELEAQRLEAKAVELETGLERAETGLEQLQPQTSGNTACSGAKNGADVSSRKRRKR